MRSLARSGGRCAALGLMLLGIGAAVPAHAGTLQVNPITVEITTDKKVASVRIKNEEKAPVTIRAYVLSWSQVDGEDRYEDSSSLILSPPVFTIAGGGTQLVRIGLRHPAAAGKAYRLIIEEVPQASPGGGVQVALRLNLPLFAMVAAGEQSDLSWSARRLGANWVIEATNGGAGWVRVDPVAAAKATGVRYEPTANLGVVLPKSTRRWVLGEQPPVSDTARFERIARTTGDDAQFAQK